MKIGKISEQVLKRSILRQVKTRRDEVLQGAGVGEDCACLKLGVDEVFVCSVDPITVSSKESPLLAIHITANDLASAGAEPIAALVSILLPPSSLEEELKAMMQGMEQACEQLKMQIIGGHTEITDGVNRPIITVTGIGKVKEAKLLTTSGVQPGEDLVLTKWIALEGTSIMASEREEELRLRFPQSMIDAAKNFIEYVSIVPEAKIAMDFGVSAMHDVTEGGIFGALWEMAECGGIGIEADLKKIPVRQESIELCEYFGLNPYVCMSSGSLLISTKDGEGLAAQLRRNEIPASVIGRTTGGNDRVLLNGGERRYLERPQPDELYKI